MILYAESSAVLSWLLAETRAEAVGAALADAELVVTSDLTLIECERALIQAVARDRITESDANQRAARLRSMAHHWICLGMDSTVADRAMAPYPTEPVRTLDAIHLAYALAARSLVEGTRLLTLDSRIRETAAALGLSMHPETA